MRIRFGWLGDGAAWAHRADSARGESADITVGPRGLVNILLTRLGLSHPPVPHAERVAAMRQIAGHVADPWYARAYERDPWNTSATLLRLRDELVESGFDPGEEPPPAVEYPRLHALWALESAVRAGREGGTGGNSGAGIEFGMGAADDLRDALASLESVVSAGGAGTWPLGIERINMSEPPEALPGLWPRLFELLQGAGVEVAADASPAHALRSITVVESPSVGGAAESAARLVQEAVAEGLDLTILATDDTLALDLALAQRGLPAVGHAGASHASLVSQALPVLLNATGPGLDPHALVALLAMVFPVDVPADAQAGQGPVRNVGLLPFAVRKWFLGALEQEPGLSDEPGSAWGRARAAIAEEAPEHREIADALHGLLAPDPGLYGGIGTAGQAREGTITSDALAARLDFLRACATRLRAAAPHSAQAILEHVGAVQAIVAGGYEDITERELANIVRATAPGGAGALLPRTVAPWSLATSPAHVHPHPGNHVIWWGATSPVATPLTTWDPAEERYMRSLGCRPTGGPEVSVLRAASEYRALAGTGSLTAIAPRHINGEAGALNPVVSRLERAVRTGHLAHESAGDGGGRGTATRDSAAGVAERLEAAGKGRRMQAWQPSAPTHLLRKTTPGLHLMPASLSFSQMSLLVNDTLSWVLQYPCGIRPGTLAQVPTGNRMVGTLVHATLETLLDPETRTSIAPEPEAIERAFDALTPRFASELLLPGNNAWHQQTRRAAVQSIHALLTTLAEHDIAIDEIEHPFAEITLPLTISGAGGEAGAPGGATRIEPVLRGSIDFTGTDSQGRPVILDFKWTNRSRGYWDRVAGGTAAQLATYAWALSRERTGDEGAMDDARVGYYMLAQGEFVTADRDLAGRVLTTPPMSDVWSRFHASAERALSRLASGTAGSEIGHIALYTDPNPTSTAHKRLAKKRAELLAERGFYFEDARATYSDYLLLTGLKGDFS